ncbi:hypothetical protein E2C01_085343 [Portunus trituberculatus]|uniref:Uncharacterized protein n=1 Tax=Portunus trituberculatus TaxID=210409 RepID=A0A5B7J2F1_PORTR|nr:hypothetical protein [Portunus trituberculatus]
MALNTLFFTPQELFPGSKYKFKSENCVHSIIISKPTVEDMGRYSVECMGISCAAILTVQGLCHGLLFCLLLSLSRS